jgi:hypothetical protein
MTNEQYTSECLATQFQWSVLNLALSEDHPSFQIAKRALNATEEDIKFAVEYLVKRGCM